MRGKHPHTANQPESVVLPVKPFLYTLDQVAQLLNIETKKLYSNGWINFHGRSTGIATKQEMVARNIEKDPDKPAEWRIAERELVRWLRLRGYKFHERGTFSH